MTATGAADEDVSLDTAAGKWVLAGMVLGSGMASLDATVVNVALPRLGDDLGSSFGGLQWVVNGYTLALASLILVGGSLGDRLGRRRVFTIGAVWFAAASLLCGLAPNLQVLVVARVLQGVGGALLAPGSLAIIQASFRPADRARAIGAWSGLGGITTAIGPFVGGWLVDAASWRYVFLLNLPLAALVIFVAVRHVPETRDPTIVGRIDGMGAVLGAAGLALATYGLIQQRWLLTGAGVAVFAVFLIVEGRVRHPMLSLAVFRSRQFSAANALTFVLYAALSMVLFLVGITLQRSLGYTPLAAGTALFPITVIMLVFSARSGALAQRIGPRLQLTVGPLLVAGGLLLMSRVHPGAGYASTLLPALLVFGSGLACTVAPLTATVLAAADIRHAGVASGVNNAVARVGGLLAVAAVPLLAGFDPAVRIAPQVLIDGFHRAVLIGAVLAATAGAVGCVFIRSDVLEAGGEEPGPPEAPGVGGQEPCFHCDLDGSPLAPFRPVEADAT